MPMAVADLSERSVGLRAAVLTCRTRDPHRLPTVTANICVSTVRGSRPALPRVAVRPLPAAGKYREQVSTAHSPVRRPLTRPRRPPFQPREAQAGSFRAAIEYADLSLRYAIKSDELLARMLRRLGDFTAAPRVLLRRYFPVRNSRRLHDTASERRRILTACVTTSVWHLCSLV